MTTIETYPNPVRIFTQARNSWFSNVLNAFKIPVHIFTSIRESQVGQLMFAIESMRIKKIRDGEDPGTSIFDGDQIDMFVPVFQTIRAFEDFISKEEVTFKFKDLKDAITKSEEIKIFEQTNFELDDWFSPVEFEKLDEVYLPAAKAYTDVLLKSIDEKLEIDGEEDLFSKVGTIDENFANMLKGLFNEKLFKAISEGEFKLDEKDQRLRIIGHGEDEFQIHYNEYYHQVTGLRGLLFEILRKFKEGKKYTRNFEFIPEIFTMDMLLMLPQPDKTRLPVVKTHLKTLRDEFKNRDLEAPLEFFNILASNYQAFTLMMDPHQRMFQKQLKSQERAFKDLTRQYWRRMKEKLTSEDKKVKEAAEENLAVLWSYFRIVQAQAQHMSQNQNDEHDHQNMVYRMMLRFEHMFWQPGRKYTATEDYTSKNHFWFSFAKIVNLEVRTPKDSLNLYNDLKTLFENSKVITNKTKRKKYGVTLRDHRSLLKTIISYGVESRNPSIFDELKKYNEKLDEILQEISGELDQHPEINMDDEKRIVEQINAYTSMPAESFPQTEEETTKRRSARRIRQ